MGNMAGWLQAALVALVPMLCGAVGYGALQARVKTLESQLTELKASVQHLQALEVTVGRIDERTTSTDNHVGRIESKLDGFFAALLGEQREQRAQDRDRARGPAT